LPAPSVATYASFEAADATGATARPAPSTPPVRATAASKPRAGRIALLKVGRVKENCRFMVLPLLELS
jgi:hypothetical protein